MRRPGELTIEEAARQLGLSEPSLRHAVARGRLPVERRLGRVFVTPEGLEAFRRWRNR
jgi:excisionase family DNA binding protein